MQDMNVARNGLTICVLGGTGFVGTRLVTRLASAGHWVRVPTRALSHGNHLRVLPTVELRVANVHEPRILGELLEGVDAVVNLVGILNEPGFGNGSGFRAVHAELAAKVTEAARIDHVPRLVHMSSVGADAQHAPSHYLRTKGMAEQYVRQAGTFLRFTIFRPSVIFGPGDSLTNRFARLLRLSRGFMPLARPTARFAPIYVDDVVEAFVRALDEPAAAGETYELCGPDIMTLEQIVRLTAKAAGLRCVILPLPDLLARLQGRVMGLLPRKPFSYDNYRSLTIDSLCRDDGCKRLGIRAQHMDALLPSYL